MHWITRLFLGLLGLGMLLGLLLALGVYTAYAALRWLLTGRKPQVVLVWQQFSALRRGTKGWGQSPGFEPPAQGEVVDVEVREVREPLTRLPRDKP